MNTQLTMENSPYDSIFNTFPRLPEKLLYLDIFSRLPVKSLCRLNCVSKAWFRLIQETELAVMQMNQAIKDEESILLLINACDCPAYHGVIHEPVGKGGIVHTTSLHLVQEQDRYMLKAKEKPVSQVNSKDRRMVALGSCNGLIYFTAAEPGKNMRKSHVIVTNPLRGGACVELPPMKDDQLSWETYGLGFDGSTNRFKMVCVYIKTTMGGNFQLGAMVHVLGSGGSWRELPQAPPFQLLRDKPVFAYGSLHWMALLDDFNKNDDSIISFDVTKEEFSSTSHPKIERAGHIVGLKGELGLVDLSCDEKVEIWVMKGYYNREKEKAWVKYCSIDMKAPLGMSSNVHLEVLGPWKSDGILIKSYEGFFIYNLEAGNLRYTTISGPRSDPTICIYQGSLFHPFLISQGDS